jgi:hypothetical protein
MPYVTIADVQQTLTQLITDKVSTVIKAFMQRGGWENWLQVELANALNARFSEIANIQREDAAPYTMGGRRVDILVSHMPDFNNPPDLRPLAIELKAESIFQSGIGNSIGNLATEDFYKICDYGQTASYQFLEYALAVSNPGCQSLVNPYNLASTSPRVAGVDVRAIQTNDNTFPQIFLLAIAFN